MVSLDGEVSNSTYAEIFRDAYPRRFFEMYIAEQNMVGAALGLATRGKIPFVSTFAAFFSRAYDQIRMSQYSDPNLKFCGSHAGVSIGEDGPSQMGLEDLAMFRAILGSVVLYPGDAVSTERLVEAALHTGASSISAPPAWPPPSFIGPEEEFRPRRLQGAAPEPPGCGHGRRRRRHPVRGPQGRTRSCRKPASAIRVIDLYSVKPVDEATLQAAARATRALITVEDHYPEGGIGDAVLAALARHPDAGLFPGGDAKSPRAASPENSWIWRRFPRTPSSSW